MKQTRAIGMLQPLSRCRNSLQLVLLISFYLKFILSQKGDCKSSSDGHKRLYKQLVCESSSLLPKNESIGSQIKHHNFQLACPVAFDFNGKPRQARHMCTVSLRPNFCQFSIPNIIITKSGGLLECDSLATLSFSHPSMRGEPPIYFHGIHDIWSSGYVEAAASHKQRNERLPTFPLVVPTRMRWDDCFNHLSFQSMPFIAHVKEFLGDVWDDLYWHASLFTAALLELLDVPKERILIEVPIRAESLVLPWVQGWCPPQLSTIHGIANRITKQMTQKLLSLPLVDKFPTAIEYLSIKGEELHLNPPGRNRGNHSRITRAEPHATSRTVIYMTRPPKVGSGTRLVVNEKELLRLLRQHLSPEYSLLVVGLTPEYKTVEDLHISWRKFARVFSRAKLIIGPHGGALNNIMWLPDDAHIIEFNEFPDDETYLQSHGQTPARHVFLTAFWAKGGSGKFWILSPSMKHPSNFYVGKMRIAPYELFRVIEQIDEEPYRNVSSRSGGGGGTGGGGGVAAPAGRLLKANFNVQQFPTETHGVWKHPNPCFDCVPPPVAKEISETRTAQRQVLGKGQSSQSPPIENPSKLSAKAAKNKPGPLKSWRH